MTKRTKKWLVLLLCVMAIWLSALAVAETNDPALPPETSDSIVLTFDKTKWVIPEDKDGLWVYTFQIPGGDAEYYLLEGAIDGYTSPDMVTPVNIGRGPYTIVNTSTEQYGELTVSKTVILPDGVEDKGQYEEEFTFTVQLTGEKISGMQTFGHTVFNDGKATVRLKHDQSITFESIPEGTQYTVTEAETLGFTASKTTITGEIEAGKNKQAGFVNTADIPSERQPVNVSLKKQVRGAYTEAGTYSVFASFTRLNPNENYLYTIHETSGDTEASFKAGTDGTAFVNVTISPDRWIEFKGLPAATEDGTLDGATYLFTEQAGDYRASYQITNDGTGGNLISNSGSAKAENEALSTSREEAEPGEQVTVTFTNTLNRTVEIDLTKIVADGLDPNVRFPFTVTFSNLTPDETVIYSSNGLQRADKDGVIVFYRDLVDGETQRFTNVPVNAKYEITEGAVKNYMASYTVTDSTGEYTVSNADDNLELGTGIRDASAVLDGTPIKVDFTNTLKLVPLMVPKTITGDAMEGVEYNFTIWVDSHTGVCVDEEKGGERIASVTDENGTVTSKALTFLPVENGYQAAFTLKADETLLLGLIEGCSVSVTEDKSPYYSTAVSADGGTIANKQHASVVMNEEHTLQFINTLYPRGSLLITKLTISPDDTLHTPPAARFTVTGPNNFSKVITYAEFSNGEYVLHDIPLGKYTVKEDQASAAIEGYCLSVTGRRTATVTETERAEVSLTNTYTVYIPTTPVTITKHWIDSGSIRPNSITLRVTASDDPDFVYTKVLSVDDPNVRVEGDTWYFYAEWNIHDYVIEEVDVPGYTSSITKNGNDFVITNTGVPETGDPNQPLLWMQLILFSLIGYVLLKKRA
ncbi:MAG: Cna B-type domain-containing protein [Clostridia bacterium]|nr:Cna B-type domain-containing protein [Clostridia bacterium]